MCMNWSDSLSNAPTQWLLFEMRIVAVSEPGAVLSAKCLPPLSGPGGSDQQPSEQGQKDGWSARYLSVYSVTLSPVGWGLGGTIWSCQPAACGFIHPIRRERSKSWPTELHISVHLLGSAWTNQSVTANIFVPLLILSDFFSSELFQLFSWPIICIKTASSGHHNMRD